MLQVKVPHGENLLQLTVLCNWPWPVVGCAVLVPSGCAMGVCRVQISFPRRGRLSDASLEASFCSEERQ